MGEMTPDAPLLLALSAHWSLHWSRWQITLVSEPGGSTQHGTALCCERKRVRQQVSLEPGSGWRKVSLFLPGPDARINCEPWSRVKLLGLPPCVGLRAASTAFNPCPFCPHWHTVHPWAAGGYGKHKGTGSTGTINHVIKISFWRKQAQMFQWKQTNFILTVLLFGVLWLCFSPCVEKYKELPRNWKTEKRLSWETFPPLTSLLSLPDVPIQAPKWTTQWTFGPFQHTITQQRMLKTLKGSWQSALHELPVFQLLHRRKIRGSMDQNPSYFIQKREVIESQYGLGREHGVSPGVGPMILPGEIPSVVYVDKTLKEAQRQIKFTLWGCSKALKLKLPVYWQLDFAKLRGENLEPSQILLHKCWAKYFHFIVAWQRW